MLLKKGMLMEEVCLVLEKILWKPNFIFRFFKLQKELNEKINSKKISINDNAYSVEGD